MLRLDAAAVAMGGGCAGEADDAAVSRSAQVSVMEASSAMTAGDDRGILMGKLHRWTSTPQQPCFQLSLVSPHPRVWLYHGARCQ